MLLSVRGFLFFTAVIVGGLMAVINPGAALAALIQVDNTDDFPDDVPGDGQCKGKLQYAVLHRCSLRAAIQEAQATTGVDNIVLEGKTYDLSQNPETPGVPGPDEIKTDLTITGVGRTSTTISFGPNTSPDGRTRFHVTNGTFRLIGLTVSGGHGVFIDIGGTGFLTSMAIDNSGDAGFVNHGTSTVTNSVITRSQAGGVENASTLAIDTSSITNNHQNGSIAGAAGVTNRLSGALTLTNSLVANNVADQDTNAGGISNGANLFIANTTISGNTTLTSAHAGGVELSGGFLSLLNVTLANNTGGPGLERTGGAFVIMQNNILANNGRRNCTGAITLNPDPQQQQNLDSGATCGFPAASNVVGVDPKLGDLANNGGPTQTHALLAGSPAVDAANCATTTDQRGVTRPIDGNLDGVARCDIGAFEKPAPFGGLIPQVGTAGLSPHDASAGIGQAITQTVTWDVPTPQIWTALQSIDYRLRSPNGIVFWLRWDQTTNLFQLLDKNGALNGPAFPGGTPYSLGSSGVSLDLTDTQGKGSGPTGQRTTLTLPLSFSEALANQTLAVELAATSDFDAQAGFTRAGTIAVGATAAATAESVSPGDDSGRVQRDKDDPPRFTEGQRRQKEHTNQAGRDQYATEGNVLETHCDADIPGVVIANRDGAVTVQLIKEAASACGSIHVGDYLEADGEKQTEQLFEADGVSVSRVH